MNWRRPMHRGTRQRIWPWINESNDSRCSSVPHGRYSCTHALIERLSITLRTVDLGWTRPVKVADSKELSFICLQRWTRISWMLVRALQHVNNETPRTAIFAILGAKLLIPIWGLLHRSEIIFNKIIAPVNQLITSANEFKRWIEKSYTPKWKRSTYRSQWYLRFKSSLMGR